MSSKFKNCSVDVDIVYCQSSVNGGAIYTVTGFTKLNDGVKVNFRQTFFLVTEGRRGSFILNDILQFSSVCESITSSANDDDKQDRAVSSVPNAG